MSLLDCEDELLAVAGAVNIANFPEASRAVEEGPYDLSLVEGSITTAHDAERIKEVREQSKFLISIGACATAGGIQALRNWKNVDEFVRVVYATPEFISTLDRSTPISYHVEVDFELRGCPISKGQLLEVVAAFLQGRRPNIPTYSVCVECKRRGNALCHGVARHPVSRPGHPGRVWSHLPGLPPGLLRMFRADGISEHGSAESLVAGGAGRGRTRSRCCVSGFQRLCGSVQGRRRRLRTEGIA